MSNRFHLPPRKHGSRFENHDIYNPIDYFNIILDPQLVQDISDFSNSKAEATNNNDTKDYEISYNTIKAFVGCAMKMGDTKLSEEKDHWVTDGDLLSSVR